MNKLDWLARIIVNKPTLRVSEADVNEMLAQVRRQHVRWVSVKRAAKIGDRLTLTYSILHGGHVVDAPSAQSIDVVLGSKTFHPTIEKRALVGAKAGERLQAIGKFPGQTSVDSMAGKRVSYIIDVLGVRRPQLPKLDAGFAKELGLKSGGRGQSGTRSAG